jgi:hypothetical protein
MLKRISLKALILIVAGMTVSTAFAEHREFGRTRPRDYDRGGYYGPRTQPVLPTRPFFVQPYPRGYQGHDRGYDRGHGNGYEHGYREGYNGGHSDHGVNRHWRGRDDHYGNNGRHRGYRRDGYHAQPQYHQPYYAPRPGFSIYYGN